MVVILLSYSSVRNAVGEYDKLGQLISKCDSTIESICSGQNAANSGQAEDVRYERTLHFLGMDYDELESDIDHMKKTLDEVSVKSKGLITCCDDFVNILRGEDAMTLPEYEGAAIGSEDLLYYEDSCCSQNGYGGSISDNTTDITTECGLQADELDQIEEKISQLQIMSVSVSSYISALRENIEKEERVDPLYALLKIYCKGCSDLNSYSEEQLLLYAEEEAEKFHVRTYNYDGVPTENLAYIDKVMLEKLDQFDIPEVAIENALERGFTYADLLGYYEGFTAEKSVQFFNAILSGDYTTAFQMNLKDEKDKVTILEDASCMTALSEYGFRLLDLDDKGAATSDSVAEFEKYMTAILNAYNINGAYQEDLLKELYAYSGILADGYATAVCAVSPDNPEYRDLVWEAEKRVAMANMYGAQYLSISNSDEFHHIAETIWEQHAAYSPDGVANNQNCLRPQAYANWTATLNPHISGFRYEDGNISFENHISFKTGITGRIKTYSTTVDVSRILYSGGDIDFENSKAFNDLKNEREKIINDTIKHLWQGGATAAATAINPALGAAVTLVLAVSDGEKGTTIEKDTVKLVNSLLKTVDSKLPDGAVTANDLAMGFIDDIRKYNENIKAGGEYAEKVATRWFGYNYSYTYEEKTFFNPEKMNSDYCSNMGGIRPEAVRGMIQWEDHGMRSFLPREVDAELTEKINDYLQNPANNVSYEDSVMVVMLYQGYYADDTLSFANMDYEQFTRCISMIDNCMNEVNEIGGQSVRDVWDDYMTSYRTENGL